MSVFAIDSGGKKQVDQESFQNRVPASQLEAGFWDGVGTGIGNGIMRGGAKTAQFIGMAAATVPIAVDAAMGDTKLQDWYFENVIDDIAGDAVEHWTPEPLSVGTAGNVLGGLSEILLPLAAAGGNPAPMIGSQSFGIGTDLVRQGVDGTTAAKVASVEAAASGIGFLIPFFGKNLSQRIASGIGGNLAVNPVAEAVQQSILQDAGFDEQAQRFDPFNLEARAIDILTGAVFGGISHVSANKFSRADKDAAATANNSKHFQYDTLPGVPRDIDANIAHQRAMEKALKQLNDGDPVSVPRVLVNAGFIDRPAVELTPLAKAFKDVHGEDIPIADSMPRVESQGFKLPYPPDTRVPTLTDSLDSMEVQAARNAVRDFPDLRIVDDDGVEMPARDALQRADDDVIRAKNESRAYTAAVACFMRFGQ